MGAGDPLVGRMIAGKLELRAKLGSGSMGHVYRAYHHGLSRPIAIKLLRSEVEPSPQQIARFTAEAKAAARLDHRHIVRVFDFGEDGPDKLLYIAMELLEGRELSSAQRSDGPFEVRRAARILSQTCAALAHAHDEGIVHRDVKPQNIMLVTRKGDDGAIPDFVKVCDFGIAKLLVKEADAEPLTLTGVTLGTPTYSSPEQIMGDPLDGRSDVYSCGVVLFSMLAGRPPFVADTPLAMAMMHVSNEPPPLSEFRADLPPALEAIVRRAMAKKADERFESTRALRAALRPFSGEESTEEQSAITLPPEPPSRPVLPALPLEPSFGSQPLELPPPAPSAPPPAPSRYGLLLALLLAAAVGAGTFFALLRAS